MNINKILEDIQSKEMELFELKLAEVVERAYLKGVEDGQAKNAYPPVLKAEHLAEILQVEMPTVRKIVQRKDFPKLIPIRARYPRDEVFKWIERNSTDFGTKLLKFTS